MEQAAKIMTPRKLYRTLKEITGKKSSIAGPLKDNQGNTIPDVQGKLDHWRRNHFKDLFIPNTDGQDASMILPTAAQRPSYKIDMVSPSTSEILNTIKQLKINKLPSEDGLSPDVNEALPHL